MAWTPAAWWLAAMLLLSSGGAQASLYCGEQNCYTILGVKRATPGLEIKKAYRKLSLQYHPDKNPTPEADAMFKSIANAYGIVSDAERRQDYDYALDHPEQVWRPSRPLTRRCRTTPVTFARICRTPLTPIRSWAHSPN
jgi:DnaJ family protein C protein 25